MHTHGIHYRVYADWVVEKPLFLWGVGHLWLPGCVCEGDLLLGNTLTAQCMRAGTDWYHPEPSLTATEIARYER